jgi:hypothetical protein
MAKVPLVGLRKRASIRTRPAPVEVVPPSDVAAKSADAGLRTAGRESDAVAQASVTSVTESDVPRTRIRLDLTVCMVIAGAQETVRLGGWVCLGALPAWLSPCRV